MADSPANSAFVTVIRVFIHTSEVFTDGAKIGRHLSSTFAALSTVFTNLQGLQTKIYYIQIYLISTAMLQLFGSTEYNVTKCHPFFEKR